MMILNHMNIKVTLRLAAAVLPGICLAIFLHNDIWLLSAFFAACGIIPYGSGHSSRVVTSIYISLILSLSLCSSHIVIFHQYLFIFVICLITVVIGFLDTKNPQLKSMGSWFLIGVLYTCFKFNALGSIPVYIIAEIWIVSILSCLFAIAISRESKVGCRKLNFDIRKHEIVEYLKYLLPIVVTLIIWKNFTFSRPEWLLWSCISVAGIELSSSSKKIRDRIVGVAIGISIGCLLLPFIPTFPYCHAVYYLGILISLRLFKKYLYGFTIRCMLIVLASSSCSGIATGEIRIINVVIGGLVGYLCVLLICFIKAEYTNNGKIDYA